MPKGTGLMVALLVLAIAGVGGWKYWDSKRQQDAGDAAGKRATAQPLASRRLPGPLGPDSRFPELRVEGREVLVLNAPANFDGVVGGLGYRIIERVRLGSLGLSAVRLALPPTLSIEQAVADLNGRFSGITVDANHRYEPQQGAAQFADRLASRLVGWATTPTCGKGIRIGMIDSGVEVRHPALAGQDVEYRSFHNPERRPGSADHGTAVAAMIAGKVEWGGLLPGATLKAANMFEMNEVGKEVGNAMGMLKALDWLVGAKMHAINMSIAGGDNKAVKLAIEKARAAGGVIVAAAGNWGVSDRPAYPAAYAETLAVTAIAADKSVYKNANTGDYIDFAAPGVEVYTAVPGGGRIQHGTSFASPFVAVLIALDVAQGKAPDAQAIRQAFQATSIDLGPKGKDQTFGYGFVNRAPACT